MIRFPVRASGLAEAGDALSVNGWLGGCRRWIASVISPELCAEAERDPLTGLPNVREDKRVVEQAVERRMGEPTAQLVRYRIDVDNLKALNDERGHTVGDEALRVLARVLDSGIREGDVLARARIGGDEFVLTVTLPERTGPEVVRDRLETAIARAFLEAGVGEAGGRAIGASIGFAVHQPGEPFVEIDTRADQAAIERKVENGRSLPRLA
jgi:diguanylate cyclase (GGDEF)-like protein